MAAFLPSLPIFVVRLSIHSIFLPSSIQSPYPTLKRRNVPCIFVLDIVPKENGRSHQVSRTQCFSDFGDQPSAHRFLVLLRIACFCASAEDPPSVAVQLRPSS